MKILMVGNDKSVHGGISSVIEQLLDYEWNKHQIKIKFIPTYIEKNSILKIIFFIVAYIKIFFIILFNKPDKVHIHMSYKGSFIRTNFIHKLCMKFKIKDIIHLHGSEFKKWYDSCNENKKIEIKKLLKECYTFIVLGEKWKKIIKEIEPETNIKVLNNTVPIPEATAKYNDKTFQVLFLGVLIKRKGVSDLLDAIDSLSKKMNLSNVKFIIAGNGSEEKKLIQKSVDLNIDMYVKFSGWIDGKQKKYLLETSQLMILPSYNEGLPVSILEGISYGLPVISTNVGDITSAVIEGVNGQLIEPGDIEKLTTSLYYYLTCSKELWKRESENSRRLAKERFSDKIFFHKLEDIYKGE